MRIGIFINDGGSLAKKRSRRSLYTAFPIALVLLFLLGCAMNFGIDPTDLGVGKRYYTITFSGNGNTAGNPPAPIKAADFSYITLPGQGSMTKSEYVFEGWLPNGNCASCKETYAGGSQYKIDSRSLTLYAIWRDAGPFIVEVTSAGTGSVGSGSYVTGTTVSISAGTTPEGEIFMGWMSSSNDAVFADASEATTTFRMPWNDVKVVAVFGVTDSRDGKTYKTVVIGGKRWMAENLNYQTPDSSWCYGDNNSNCIIYGRLYTWEAAKTACPSGWKLPDTTDWNRLVEAGGGSSVAGKALKSTGWYSSSGTDTYGFSALPGGGRDAAGAFVNVGYGGYWWTAAEYGSSYAYTRIMYYYSDGVYEYGNGKSDGYSVRCVADE